MSMAKLNRTLNPKIYTTIGSHKMFTNQTALLNCEPALPGQDLLCLFPLTGRGPNIADIQ